VLDELKQTLLSNPTDIDAASRYWTAVGSAQSGQYVIEAFRSAALSSQAGVIALAPAYKELFENSGEPPRAPFFDKNLVSVLEIAAPTLSEPDRSTVEWILNSIR